MGGAYHWGLIIHQQRYLPSDRNKNVDIEFSAHDAFLTEPSSGRYAECQKIRKPNNLLSKCIKGPTLTYIYKNI